MSLANMSKALKCANNDDTCMIKYEEGDSDSITFTFADTKRDKTQVRFFSLQFSARDSHTGSAGC